MAWVTKDSVEQYETPESKKEYTKQEKAANWWHYHKLYVGIAVIAVVLVVWMVCTSGGKTSSWVRVEGSGTAEFTCGLQEPIQSWAIYEDVYENVFGVSPERLQELKEQGVI